MRSLIDPTDLSLSEIDDILALADDIMKNRPKYAEVCKGKKLATLFYEPSTRTRLSFEAAMMELGGNVLGFSSADNSSASKGESVADTARIDGAATRTLLRYATSRRRAPPWLPSMHARYPGHQRRRRRTSIIPPRP